MVELLATVACASLVTLAALSLMLVCMRVDRSARNTAGRQSDTRMILALLEDAAGTGGVEQVETVGEDWTLSDGGGQVLLRYSAGEDTLKTGAGTVMMAGVEDSRASLSGNLLTLSLRTAGEQYETSVYCRTHVQAQAYSDSGQLLEEAKQEMQDDPPEGDRLAGTEDARYGLLEVLSTQFSSEGDIRAPYNGGEYSYYSEWYIGGYTEGSGWDRDTPWCACFLSWAAAQLPEGTLETVPRFANVNEGMEQFRSGAWGGWLESGEEPPLPGDFLFFDWDGDADPDHVGAVLLVRDGSVYTIEGNSGGKVAVHSYGLSDPSVLGYGLLNWRAAGTDGDGV